MFAKLRTDLEPALYEQQQIALSGKYDFMAGETDDLPYVDSVQKEFLDALLKLYALVLEEGR